MFNHTQDTTATRSHAATAPGIRTWAGSRTCSWTRSCQHRRPQRGTAPWSSDTHRRRPRPSQPGTPSAEANRCPLGVASSAQPARCAKPNCSESQSCIRRSGGRTTPPSRAPFHRIRVGDQTPRSCSERMTNVIPSEASGHHPTGGEVYDGGTCDQPRIDALTSLAPTRRADGLVTGLHGRQYHRSDGGHFVASIGLTFSFPALQARLLVRR